MNAASLDSFVSIPVSSDLYVQLVHRHPGRVSSIVEDVVQDFLDRTAAQQSESDQSKGYQWERVFLPAGTQLRAKYHHEYKVGTIREDGYIVKDGKKYSSPSQFARAMRGGTSNNAWKVLYVKRAFDPDWKLADGLRQ